MNKEDIRLPYWSYYPLVIALNLKSINSGATMLLLILLLRSFRFDSVPKLLLTIYRVFLSSAIMLSFNIFDPLLVKLFFND